MGGSGKSASCSVFPWSGFPVPGWPAAGRFPRVIVCVATLLPVMFCVRSLPGAVTHSVTYGDIPSETERFSDLGQVAKMIGLAPQVRQSGETRHEEGILKAGASLAGGVPAGRSAGWRVSGRLHPRW